MINVDISPKKPANFEITISKLVYGFTVFLVIFLMYKINSSARLQESIITLQAQLILGQIGDTKNEENFNKYFTIGSFCGWQFSSASGTSSSQNFEGTSGNGKLLEREFKKGEIAVGKLSVCLDTSYIDRSERNQIIATILIGGVLILLIFLNSKNDEDKKKIPNS